MTVSSKAWGRLILWAWVVILVMPRIGEGLGRIEGRLHPVVSATQITDAHEVGARTVFYGSAIKDRKCAFREVRWFLGRPGGEHIRIALEFLEHDKLRPLGPLEFGPWAVHLSADDLRRGSYADVLHDCHALYPTVSRLWLPPPTP